MKLYIILLIAVDDSVLSLEPVGVFSTVKKANSWIKKLESLTVLSDEYNIVYDIIEYDLDTEPPLMEWLKQRQEKNQQNIEESIADLMKKGMIDQLVGEDGHFYYTLTDLGKEEVIARNNKSGLNSFYKKYFKDK